METPRDFAFPFLLQKPGFSLKAVLLGISVLASEQITTGTAQDGSDPPGPDTTGMGNAGRDGRNNQLH